VVEGNREGGGGEERVVNEEKDEGGAGKVYRRGQSFLLWVGGRKKRRGQLF
jgi:hypothetical protein